MNRVKEYLIGSGMSQKQLAAFIQVSRPTVSDWVNNKTDPRGDNLHRLAEVFNVPWQDILIDEVSTAVQPAQVAPVAISSPLSDIEFALAGEIHGLTYNEKLDVLDYVRFKKAKKNDAK